MKSGEVKYTGCDVLVIGSGGGALRAAIAAKERLGPQGRVVVVTKGELGKCGVTALSCSDRMAFHVTLPYTEPGGEDNWRYHAADIYELGGRVSDADLAEILAKEAYSAFSYLTELGVPWALRPDGRFDQFITDGSEYARACYTGPHTANHIEEALVRKTRESGIEVVENCMVWELLKSQNERVVGALGFRERSDSGGEWLGFLAGAVVLATGGAGSAFAINVFPPGQTGDGYAMAYRAGASLVNMEFIQIGLSSVKTKLACSGSIMRAIPRFINDRDEEFLMRYFPRGTPPGQVYATVFRKGASWPVSREKPTFVIDVAVQKEINQGRRVYLDFSQNPAGFEFALLPEELRERYFREARENRGEEARASSPFARLMELNPQSVEWLRVRGVDLAAGELLQIAPAIQHFQGGVKIGRRAETTLPGLFACGEVAGGQHGANRPGGNALLDAQVFGRIAGESAADYAMKMAAKKAAGGSGAPVQGESPGTPAVDLGEEALARLHGEWERATWGATRARRMLEDVLYASCGVVRTQDGLLRGLEVISQLAREGIRPDDAGVIFALETHNMLQVGEMVIRACLMRRESRGPHLFFEDPDALVPLDSNPLWEKYIVITRGKGDEDDMQLEVREPVRFGASR